MNNFLSFYFLQFGYERLFGSYREEIWGPFPQDCFVKNLVLIDFVFQEEKNWNVYDNNKNDDADDDESSR